MQTLYSHTHKQPYALVVPDPTTEYPKTQCIVYYVWSRYLSLREAKHRAKVLIRKYDLPKGSEVVPSWRVMEGRALASYRDSQAFNLRMFGNPTTNFVESYYVIKIGPNGPYKLSKEEWIYELYRNIRYTQEE